MKKVFEFLMLLASVATIIYIDVTSGNQRIESYLDREPTCDGQAHSLDFQGSIVRTPGPILNKWLKLNPDVVILETTLPHWDMDPLTIKYTCQ